MIYFEIPSIPPSSNTAYANIRGTNKRVLTTEGKAYKRVTIAHLIREYPKEMKFFEDKNQPYLMLIRFWLEHVQNKTWSMSDVARYKKIDTGNRLKLFEDALKEAAAVDDSQNITLILQKFEGFPERTEVWVWNTDLEETPFDDVLASL